MTKLEGCWITEPSKPVSIAMKKNSPFKTYLDVFIMKLMENGFIQSWIYERKYLDMKKYEGYTSIDLMTAFVVFILIGCGLLLATVVWVLEIYWRYGKEIHFRYRMRMMGKWIRNVIKKM